MTVDPESMKSLIAFKKRLEEQLEKLSTESKEIQAALDTVNSILLERGFRRADAIEVSEEAVPKEVLLPKQEPEITRVIVQASQSFTQPAAEYESVIPLKTMAEEPLALVYFDKQGMHVMPDESKNFSVNTPPFNNFLVEKVFAKMEEKDAELVRTKQLAVDRMFSYNIVKEGDLIREIIIRNVDDERLKELKSSVRWTFEKMYEKMKSS